MNRFSRFIIIMGVLLSALTAVPLSGQVNLASAGATAKNGKGQLDATVGQLDYGNFFNGNYFFQQGLQQPFVPLIVNVDSLLCASAVFAPAEVLAGQAALGTVSIDYQGGNGLELEPMTFSSTGVSGLALLLDPMTLEEGNGVLTLRLTGTAATAGMANFDLVIGEKTCQLSIEVFPQDLELPDFFSPNGDGIYDVWGLPALELKYPGSRIYIFDRFGKRVAQLFAYEYWDGQLQGVDVPSGVYWYMVETREKTNPLTGSITLMR